MAPPIMPKDAEAMVELLKKVGVVDYEPRVINFLVELAYRSSFTLLEDAHALAEYSNKEVATAEDVCLAIRLNEEKCSDLRSIVRRHAEEINAVDLPAFNEDFDASTSLTSLDNAMRENYQLRSDFKQLLEKMNTSMACDDVLNALEDVGDAGIPEKRQKLDF
ncbi:transcription initiation factor TFIID subunit [Trichuris trichiura]|uniref:Transcription initiation factor TFIID subunit n=1 Tax=Trichuris trichiura TaxID=36087 RepID=A0A077Z3B1_TRITR|nr:transcription initiation factor TFIID subunit [Trichuris trichiura]